MGCAAKRRKWVKAWGGEGVVRFLVTFIAFDFLFSFFECNSVSVDFKLSQSLKLRTGVGRDSRICFSPEGTKHCRAHLADPLLLPLDLLTVAGFLWERTDLPGSGWCCW